jgi:hypothetical protein
MRITFILSILFLVGACHNSKTSTKIQIPEVPTLSCDQWYAEMPTVNGSDINDFTLKVVGELMTHQAFDIKNGAKCLDKYFKITCDVGSCKTERIIK